MKRPLILVLLVALTLTCNLIKNELPLVDEEPKLLMEVKNGQKLLIGDPNNTQGNYLYIANLKGTHEEMGKAFGEMFKEEMEIVLNDFYDYYMDQLETVLAKKLPKFMAEKVTGGVRSLLKKILDLNIRITKKYTNPRYYEEIKGIAAGTGKKHTAHDVARLNMFPELIKAACTVAGVWNAATANKQTLHVRGLDWDSNTPLSKFPAIVVYHPSDPKIQKHANFGWVGFIGSMTGVSEHVSLG
jgi:isopenicillin-N N-acyltransferase like protein